MLNISITIAPKTHIIKKNPLMVFQVTKSDFSCGLDRYSAFVPVVINILTQTCLPLLQEAHYFVSILTSRNPILTKDDNPRCTKFIIFYVIYSTKKHASNYVTKSII